MKKGWQDIRKEIEAGKSQDKPAGDFDGVRRAKYKLVSGLTGRPLVVYATAFHNPIKVQVASPFLSIDLSDKDGFHEVTRNLTGDAVDVFIHSPGGSAEATESIVKILRNKFKDVRFIVTGTAKSAATMMIMSGNSILMDSNAELGPVDPQVRVRGRFSPAGSIIEQFDRASTILAKNPEQLPVWIPILQEFAPALLVECENYIKLSKKLVSSWLAQFMFAGETRAKHRASTVARFLANEKNSLSHARRIDLAQLQSINCGLKVKAISAESAELQDALGQLHLAIMATLDSTGAVKIFENSDGEALIRSVGIQQQAQQ
ncbi:MAG: ATP-dependent Clp protease proteolytic subunit [Candidatus Paceibacterota bacterium]|jgi:hypothetical protein